MPVLPGTAIVTRVPVPRDQYTVASAIRVRSTACVVVTHVTGANEKGVNANWLPPNLPLTPLAPAPV